MGILMFSRFLFVCLFVVEVCDVFTQRLGMGVPAATEHPPTKHGGLLHGGEHRLSIADNGGVANVRADESCGCGVVHLATTHTSNCCFQ